MKLGTLMFCSLLKKNLKSDFENSKEGLHKILGHNDPIRKDSFTVKNKKTKILTKNYDFYLNPPFFGPFFGAFLVAIAL